MVHMPPVYLHIPKFAIMSAASVRV